MKWVFVGAAVLALVILLEGRRQARRYGRPSGRPNLGGAGMLELQSLLQADRHVETLVRQEKGEEVADAEQDESGAGARGGRQGPRAGQPGREKPPLRSGSERDAPAADADGQHKSLP
jgi:hypothetical protein